jgi:outer membrane protein assembly factor BamB
LWRTPRKTTTAGYASPVVWRGNIVIAGSERLTAYDLSDGRERWTLEGLSTYVVPTPVSDGALLYATSSGPGGSVVLAIKPNGQVAWRANKGSAYVASPVMHGTRLYTVNRNCAVSCIDAHGALLWSARLGARGDCYASPVVAGGLLHIVASSGEVYSLEAGRDFAVRNTFDLGENTIASPAVSQGLLFVRSDQHLFALGSAVSSGNRP